MAKNNGNKKLPKKTIEGRETATPSGGQNFDALIKGEISLLGEALSTGLASFYVGNADKGKDMNSFINNVKQNKKSILGTNNSIYKLLEDLRKLFYSKNFIKSFTKNSNNINTTITSIYSKFNELFNKDVLDKRSETSQKNMESLIDITNKLYDKLDTFNNSESNSNTEYLKKLEELFKTTNTKLESISNLDLSKVLPEIKLSDESKTLLESISKLDLSELNNYIQSNNKILEDNADFLNKLLNLEENLDELNININERLKESIDKIKTYCENTTQKLFDINKELRDQDKQELLEAKLKLTLEGFDSNSIQSLSEFSKINFDQADINAQNIISFLKAIESLELLQLDNAKAQLNSLPDVLNPLMTNIENIKDISSKIDKDKINNLVDVINGIKDIMISLNEFPTESKLNIGDTVKSVVGFNVILTTMLYSAPLIGMVNLIFSKDGGNKKINLNTLKEILGKFGEIFTFINSDSVELKNMNMIKSLGYLDLILGAILYSIPLIVSINKIFKAEEKNGLVNLGNTIKVFDEFEKLFKSIGTINQLDSEKMIKSLNDLSKINTVLLKNLLKMRGINIAVKLKNGNVIERYAELFDKNGNLNTLFTNLKSLNAFDNTDQIVKSINDFIIIQEALKTLKPENFDNELIIETINQLSSLFDIIKPLNNKIDNANIKDIEEGITSLNTVIQTIKNLKIDNTTNKNLEDINSLLLGQDNSLSKIFENIKTNINDSIDLNVLNNVGVGILGLKDIIDAINQIESSIKNPDKLQEGLDNYLKTLEESYKAIKEKFEEIIATGDLADKVKASNKSIQEALENNNETIVKTSSKQEDIKTANASIEGMTSFMIGAAVVMSIGALFVMMGGGKFIKASIQFGLSLALFEGIVLLPALLFFNQKETALSGIKEFNSFVVVCAMTMLVGAIIYSLAGGKLVKNAIAFGITLSVFEALIIAPILLFNKGKKDLLKGINEFKSFVITTTIIMLIGALAMHLLGGKLVTNALKFATALMAFEFLVVLPFVVFGKVSSKIFDYAKEFTGLLIVCTTIMILGAVFTMLGGGKFVKAAYEFGKSLMIFEAMVIAPFLLFNLIKKEVFDGIKAFGSVVFICTTVLLIGAVFMSIKNGKFVKSAMEFAWLLMKFEAMVIAPFLLFNAIKGPIMGGLKSFAVALLAVTTVLMIGAVFMIIGGGKYPLAAMGFATLLAVFELAVIAPILLFESIKKVALNGVKDFGLFIATCAFSLIIGAFFIAIYGSKPVLEFGIVLTGFVLITTGAMTIFSKFGKTYVNDAAMFGIFVLACSASLVIGAIFIKKYGADSALAFAILLGSFVFAMSLVMKGLSRAFMAGGGEVKIMAQMAALGGFLLAATASIALGSWVIDKYGWKSIGYAGLLLAFVTIIGSVFAILGLPPLAVLIGTGTIVATGIGIALLALSGSIMLVNLMFKSDPKGKRTKENIDVLEFILKDIFGIFTALGLFSILIIPGAIAATAIGGAITILGASLSLINLLINPIKNELIDNITVLIAAIGQIGLICGELILLWPILLLATPGLALLNIFSLGLTTSVLMVVHSIKKMSEIGSIDDQIKVIVNNLQSFINIVDEISFGGITGIMKKIAGIGLITLLVKPLAYTMGVVAETIQNLASLKIPIAWDKNGKATNFRTLKEEDFNLVNDNVRTILTTMADAMYYTWYGDSDKKGLKEFFTGNPLKVFSLFTVLRFSKEMGKVLKSVAEGIGAMAKIQIPIAWDKDGNAISYRQLKDKDFNLAARGTRKVIFALADIIMDLYKDGTNPKFGLNGKNIFDSVSDGIFGLFSSNESSPFTNTLQASLKIGEVIGNIANGIGNLAKMQIPIAWDSNGKVTAYRHLNENDFTKASENISFILTNMFTCLGDLYAKGTTKEFGGKENNNIFDAVNNIFTSDEPAPVIAVIEASLKVSELISNVGKGIKEIATMMIPNRWNDKGLATNYVHLTREDFTDAANSIADILTCVIRAISSEDILKEFDSDNVKNLLESMAPVSDLISGTTESILKLASGQIPFRIDPKTGHVIEYKRLTSEDYISAGVAISTILTFMIYSLKNAVYGIKGDGSDGILNILEGDTFKTVIESISGVGGLIFNIADSVIKMGQGLIPDGWDKEGRVIHYDKINYDTATEKLNKVVTDILMATVNAVLEAYNKEGGIKSIIGDNENSPFMIAVQGISTIMQTVSSITDSVVKLGQAQIPIDWDKDGKPIRWEKISVEETLKNINKIFIGDGTNGIFTILCEAIKSVHETYFKDENNISEIIPNITNSIGQIITTVSDTADLLVKIGSLALPTGFDNEGKPTGLHIIKPDDITNAKTNIELIMTSLLDIFNPEANTESKLKPYLESVKINTENINNNINNTGSIISTLISQLNILTTSKDVIAEIIKIKGYTPKNNDINIEVAFIRDIYTILNSYLAFNELINIKNIDLNQSIITKYSDIKTILDNINNISLTLISDITELYSEIKSEGNIKDIIDFVDLTKTNNIKNIIENIINVYSGIHSLLYSNSLDFTEFGYGSFEKNLSILIRSINNIYDILNEKNKKSIINKENNINDIIINILKIYTSIYEEIKKSELNNTIEFNNIYSNINNISNYFRKLLSNAKLIISELDNITNIKDFNKYINSEYIPNTFENILGLFDNISENLNNENKFKNIKENDNNEIFNSLKSNLSDVNLFIDFLIKEYNILTNTLNTINNDIDLNSLTSVITFYSNALSLINNVYLSSFNNSFNNNGSQNLLMINMQIMHISGLLTLMFNNMGIIYDTFYKNVNNFKNNIDSIIGQLDMSDSSLYTSIEALKTNLNAMHNIYKTEFADIKFDDENNIIHNISDDLQYFVNNAINPFDQDMFTKFNNLNGSIDTVYNTITKQKNVKEFRLNTNELGNYIKVINSVQLNKLKPLTTLVQELNKLANKLGGLDKLTEHLSNELGVVLKELVDALNESKETITDAHKIQKERHEQINKSINTIKGLMNMPLNVNIQSTGQNTNTDTYLDNSDTSSITKENSTTTIVNNEYPSNDGNRNSKTTNPDKTKARKTT